jgi:uncharacterized protein
MIRRIACHWRSLGIALLVALPVSWLLPCYVAAYVLTRRGRPEFAEMMPAVSWGPLQHVRLTTTDGEKLGAWFSVGQPERPIALLLHGNHGSRRDCLPQAALLAAQGYGVFLVSQRCHGDSTGSLNDFGYSARHDVIAAVRWLEKHQPSRRRLVWGCSLGAAAATFAAAELGDSIGGYVLECPYQDLYTAVRHRTELYLPPVLDRIGYAGMVIVSGLVLSDIERISPARAIAAFPASVPVLVLAGGADRVAHPAEAEALCRGSAASAELVVMPGAGHAQLYECDPSAYRRTVLAFCDRAFGK